MYRRSLALLGNREEARDAVHDVFVKLSRNASGFRGDSALTTWIYRVVTNHCLNVIRNQRTHRRLEAQSHVATPLDPGPGATVERRLLVEQLLVRFDDRRAQMIIHWYFDELSQAEIAAVMGVSERGVRKALQRFHAQAKDLLRDLEATQREVSA